MLTRSEFNKSCLYTENSTNIKSIFYEKKTFNQKIYFKPFNVTFYVTYVERSVIIIIIRVTYFF